MLLNLASGWFGILVTLGGRTGAEGVAHSNLCGRNHCVPHAQSEQTHTDENAFVQALFQVFS